MMRDFLFKFCNLQIQNLSIKKSQSNFKNVYYNLIQNIIEIRLISSCCLYFFLIEEKFLQYTLKM